MRYLDTISVAGELIIRGALLRTRRCGTTEEDSGLIALPTD